VTEKEGSHSSGVNRTKWAGYMVWPGQAVLSARLCSIGRAQPADSVVCADRSRFGEGNVLSRDAANGHTGR
jgi:hypothetical protein